MIIKKTSSKHTTVKRCESIAELKCGDVFDGTVKILRKAKPGPVVFKLSDGYQNIDGVMRDSSFNVDDVVDVVGSITEHAGSLQVEIDSIEKSNVDFNKILSQRYIPVRVTFSIESERYRAMEPGFLEIARRIRMAIFNNQPLIIRHHNDSDGISAGLAIEQSCKQLMMKIGMNPTFNLYRNPNNIPFYDVSDAFRDVGLAQRLVSEHDQKSPLLILLDTGSTPENLFSLRIVKTFGLDCIVIDHHNPIHIVNNQTPVCPYLLYHLNPYLYGWDNQTSAGMLAYELARMINEDYEKPILPAVAAISDRCNIVETDLLIEQSYKSREDLTLIGIAVDFMAYQLKYDPGAGVYEQLYENLDLVKIINEEVQTSVNTQLQSTLPYLQTQEINGISFSTIDLEKYTSRFKYPTPGKVLGMIHDNLVAGKEKMPFMTVGYVSDMIIVRATREILSVQKMIELIHEHIPEANIEGGGHEQAGTLKFIPAHLSRILELIKDTLAGVMVPESENAEETSRVNIDDQ